jgi:peroxiredoxin
LFRDLEAYIRRQPQAADVDQAYLTLFDRVLEHEWYADAEPIAHRYLDERGNGPSRPIALFVGLMARAKAGQYAEALNRLKVLLGELPREDQREFAFLAVDSLARTAIAASEYTVARQVWETYAAREDGVGGDNPSAQQARAEVARLALIGKPAPAISRLNDVQGKPVRWSDYRGQYVLVEFWSTSCAPCVADLPGIQAVYERYRNQGLAILGISLDETRVAALDFAKARQIPWRQVHAATAGDDVVAAFGVTTLPASFLIDPQGQVIHLDLRGPQLDEFLRSQAGGTRR